MAKSFCNKLSTDQVSKLKAHYFTFSGEEGSISLDNPVAFTLQLILDSLHCNHKRRKKSIYSQCYLNVMKTDNVHKQKGELKNGLAP